MVMRDELNDMSGEHFGIIYNAIHEVADQLGDVTLPAIADFVALGIGTLRNKKASE